jgi:threonine dehydrogenase-like Zn-dependent dehydrogenase
MVTNRILDTSIIITNLGLRTELVRPFGVISSVGVHQNIALPFSGQQLYDKNISLDFGRCPVRTIFPQAFDLLVRRQEVFSGIGSPGDLIEKVVDLQEAPSCYEEFNEGLTSGKTLFKS